MTASAVERQRVAFPRVVWDAPLFRGLDARAEREIEAAGELRKLGDGEELYRSGDDGDSFFVVASGTVSVSARRRGDDEESVLRKAHAGESFGEESVATPRRRSTARAEGTTTIAEIPVHIFRRAVVRSGKAELADRLERTMQRSATRDVLRTTALARDLDEDTFDILLDAVTTKNVGRGEPIYREGDPPDALWLVADGRVQIQTEDQARLRVRGYLGPGDFFGDEELAARSPRRASAVASGPLSLLSVPERVVRELLAQDPGLLAKLRRIATDEGARQGALIGGAAKNATQHVFRDLYRLEIARSLLVIDLESCVRCGHCSWACGSLHGTPRLVRRGDKIVSRKDAGREGAVDLVATRALGAEADLFRGALSEHLMLPSSCQHCENPACMVDCPTGAIGKDARGEVFIREALCTGCGACARACPWTNIQMAPRPANAPRPKGTAPVSDVAVKCDLCSGYTSGPACVEACPTAAIKRIDPSEELSELRALLGRRGSATGEAAPFVGIAWLASAAVAAVAVAGVGAVMQSRGLFAPSHGLGYAAGVASAVGFFALFGYAVPKRGQRFTKQRAKEAHAHATPAKANATRSIARPHLVAHVALGLVATALALAHAPLTMRGTPAQTLLLAFLATSLVGLLTAVAYAVIPRRLARIERTAVLPEDFASERQALLDRLFRSVTGRSDVVKKLAERVLLPYARSRLGSLGLLVSGRDLRAEQVALRARIDRILEGRGKDRLAGVDDLVRVCVEIRALPAQRLLVRILRVGLPIHVVCFSIATVLVFLHVFLGVGR